MHDAPHPGGGRGRGKACGGSGFAIGRRIETGAMRPVGEVNDDLDTAQVARPIGLRADIADRLECDASNRRCLSPRQPDDVMALRAERAA